MSIIVPVEENQDGNGGRSRPGSRDEERRRDLAATIALKAFDEDHRRNIDDAAAKKAYIAYSDQAAALLHGDDGLLYHEGADADAAFPAVAAGLADAHDQAITPLSPTQRGIVAFALGDRLNQDLALAGGHVREQGVIEQRRQSVALQQAAARDAAAHAADADLHDHYLATGENAISQQAMRDKVPDDERDRRLADYRSAVRADSFIALATRDPARVAEADARFGTGLTDSDRRRVAVALMPKPFGDGAQARSATAQIAPAVVDTLGQAQREALQVPVRPEPARFESAADDAPLDQTNGQPVPGAASSASPEPADDVAADGVTPKIFKPAANVIPGRPNPDPASLPVVSDVELDGLRQGSLSPKQQERNRAQARADLSDPRVRTLLDMIGYFEGADQGAGYAQVQKGDSTRGRTMTDFSRFPDIGLAAGRYQMEKKNMYRYGLQNLGITSYHPDDQDMVAAFVIRRFHVLDRLEAGDTAGAIDALAGKWRSIPTHDNPRGVSGAGRGDYATFFKIYNEIYPIEVENIQRRAMYDNYLKYIKMLPGGNSPADIGMAINQMGRPANIRPILDKYHIFDANRFKLAKP